MKSNARRLLAAAGFLLLAPVSALHAAPLIRSCPANVPEVPTMPEHIEQADILAGVYYNGASSIDPFGPIFAAGGRMAEDRWNSCDGQGRPASKGGHPNDGVSQKRTPDEPSMTRASGPEGSSCFGCHAQPRSGGSGDFVANTFNGAEDMDPITYSIDPSAVNERNTPGMFGSGYVELLGREMTVDLQRQAASIEASGVPGWTVLNSKGVQFQVYISNKQVTDARGVDTDLIVKPFGAGGTVVSIRQFTAQAMNRHHGMQAEESYDIYMGDPDFDQDGVSRELTIGDMTVITLWQAMLNMPIRDNGTSDTALRQQIATGEQAFSDVGCASCHVPTMVLNDRTFCEPNPNNPPQIFHDQSQKYCVPLKMTGFDQSKAGPHSPVQGTLVHAYTDLKRHDLCDPTTTQGAIRNLCTEHNNEGRPNQGSTPGYEYFKTAPLWTTFSSAPYGHDGRYPSVYSVILVHGGEARAARDAYLALPFEEQQDVIKFLKSMRVDNQRIRVNNNS